MWSQSGEPGRTWIGRVPHKGDLLDNLQEFARKEKIECARVEVIGAVEKAVISYYHQQEQKYQDLELNQNLEIVSCQGNISLRDNSPAAHVHIALGNPDGELRGGHLQKGTIVFAAEFIIQEIKGPRLHRVFETQTGLPLWRQDLD